MLPPSTGCGPTSRNTRCPASTSAPSASANRTGRRTLSSQYAAPQPASVTAAPVTEENSGTVGTAGAMSASSWAISGRIGSISREW